MLWSVLGGTAVDEWPANLAQTRDSFRGGSMTTRQLTMNRHRIPPDGADPLLVPALAQDAPRRESGRLQLQLLDKCLNELESAHERNDLTVGPELAAMVNDRVPAVATGMRIADALELVFREQEQYLQHYLPGGKHSAQGPYHTSISLAPIAEAKTTRRRQADTFASAHHPDASNGVKGAEQGAPEAAEVNAENLDAPGARSLTDEIKSAGHRVCVLLLQAHQRRAWSALGYPTWERYVHCEFGMSRSRSYELLDQGRILVAIRAAAGLSGYPDISAVAATQIRGKVEQVLEDIRARTAKIPPDRAAGVVAAVVREYRARHHGTARESHRGNRAPGEDSVQPGADGSEGLVLRTSRRGKPLSGDEPLSQMYKAVQLLAAMPAAAATVARIPEEHEHLLKDLASACAWLNAFAVTWSRRIAAKSDRLPPPASRIVAGTLGRAADLSSNGSQPTGSDRRADRLDQY